MSESFENEPAFRYYTSASDAFHDSRRPTATELLERSRRLASESMRAIALQLRRFEGSEPEDAEWLFRRWMDFQFLVVALWRLRMVAVIAASAFDQELPDLKTMRHVSQHLDDYATDHPTKRRAKEARHQRTDRTTAAGSWVLGPEPRHLAWQDSRPPASAYSCWEAVRISPRR
jgi:hypothetical protein